MRKQRTDTYEDMIHLPHPVSKKHSQMPIRDRAAQFAPFAALTGHREAIQEAQRQIEPVSYTHLKSDICDKS